MVEEVFCGQKVLGRISLGSVLFEETLLLGVRLHIVSLHRLIVTLLGLAVCMPPLERRHEAIILQRRELVLIVALVFRLHIGYKLRHCHVIVAQLVHAEELTIV